jgi:hypothetical protein
MTAALVCIAALSTGVSACACWQLLHVTKELHSAQAGWSHSVKVLHDATSEAHAATERAQLGWREAVALSRQLESRHAQDLLLERTREAFVSLDRSIPLRYRMN